MGLGHSCPCRRVIFHRNSLDQSVFYFGHAELAIPSHSEQLWWEKIGKVVNQVKLAITSHSGPLWWEKIGKVVNQVKLAILSHSEPLWWEKIGNVFQLFQYHNVMLTQNSSVFNKLEMYVCNERGGRLENVLADPSCFL